MGKCKAEGVLYKLSCENCGSIYVGETSRSVYNRVKEHNAGHLNQAKDNALWKHSASQHEGIHQRYKCEVVSKHREPLERQITEWVEIVKEGKVRKLLN